MRRCKYGCGRVIGGGKGCRARLTRLNCLISGGKKRQSTRLARLNCLISRVKKGVEPDWQAQFISSVGEKKQKSPY